jgi:hypothetical protein
MNYKDVISAKNRIWKVETRHFMESGSEFVVLHLSPEDWPDCKALAQEFDYDCLLEDKTPIRESIIREFPNKLPSTIGFVKRRTS